MKMLVYNRDTKEYRKEKVRKPKANEVSWVRLFNPSENEVIKVLGGVFRCHPLLVTQAMKPLNKIKVQQYEEQFFFTFSIVNISYQIIKINIVVGRNYVVTITDKEVGFLEDLYHEIQEVKNRMDHVGEVLYQILQRCVEEYGKVIKRVESEVMIIENKIIENPYIQLGHDIFQMKKTMQGLRLVFVEELSIVNDLIRIKFPYINDQSVVYFENIYDHIARIVDSMDIYRESISSLLDLQMSMRGDKMNEIMKTLTVFSTIFLPLTFVAGVYGMNFENFPEVKWEWGYAFFWAIVIGLGFAMWSYFKKKDWF